MSFYIAQDLMVDVFSRLPVKTMIRFKSLSKLWGSVIEEASFIHSHNMKRNHIPSLIVKTFDYHKFTMTLHAVELQDSQLPKVTKISLPEFGSYYRIFMGGSCNGLVCLYCLSSDSKQDIIIWNAATKEHIVIPTPCKNLCWLRLNGYGFGYEPIGDDYKFVIIDTDQKKDTDNQRLSDKTTKVYSLRKHEWKWSLHNFLPFLRSNGMLFRGALHWDSSFKSTQLITAFDLRLDQYREVPLPDCIDNIGLGVIRECISATTRKDEVVYEIWLMKDYMVRESWTKVYSIDLSNQSFTFAHCVHQTRNDEALFFGFSFDGGKVFSYNTEKKEAKRLRLSTDSNNAITDAVVYQESLVRITSYIGQSGTRWKPTFKKSEENRQKEDP